MYRLIRGIISVVVLLTVSFTFVSSVQTVAESKTVELVISFWGSAQQIQMRDAINKLFMKENPDIKVRLMHITDDYRAKINVLTAAGMTPDVMFMDPMWGYSWAKEGLFEDLGPYLKKDPVFLDNSKYFVAAFSSLRTEDMIYALPTELNGIVMFYNRDLFDQNGCEFPLPGKAFRYTHEFLDAARKMTRDTNGDGQPDTWGVGWGTMVNWYATMQNMIWPFGGEWILNRFETEYGDPKEVYLSDTKTQQALQFWADLRHRYHVAPMTFPSDIFPEGKAAMDIRGAWDIDFIKEKSLSWDIAVVPSEIRTMPTFGSWGLAMSAKSKHRKEAWELMKFHASYAGQHENCKTGQAIPFLREVALSNDFLKAPGMPEHHAVRLVSIDKGRVRFRFYSNFSEMEAALGRELASLLEGRQSPKAMADKLTPVLRDLLRKAR